MTGSSANTGKIDGKCNIIIIIDFKELGGKKKVKSAQKQMQQAQQNINIQKG